MSRKDSHGRRGAPRDGLAWAGVDRHDGCVSSTGLQLSTATVLHLHARGPGIDYIGVVVASAASWAGLPGLGEAALIAAGISAAHQHLDLAAIIAVAWLGATVGGMIGWIV